jgi:hypothetical protein
MSRLLIISLLLLAPGWSPARTWRVPTECPTIYGAIDSASYGDTVLVAPGTYCREREKVVPGGVVVWLEMKDGVTLTSEAGPEFTTLVETSPIPVNITILCDSIVDAEISGFTLVADDCPTLGSSQSYDYGIVVVASDMVVENNILLGYFTWGILVERESPRDGTPVIRNNEVRNAWKGITVGEVFRHETPLIEGNTVRDCFYGIWCRDTNAYIVGNTVVAILTVELRRPATRWCLIVSIATFERSLNPVASSSAEETTMTLSQSLLLRRPGHRTGRTT